MINYNQKNETRAMNSKAILCQTRLMALGLCTLFAGMVMAFPSAHAESEPTVTSISKRFALDPSVKSEADTIRLDPNQTYDDTLGYGFTNTKDGNEQALAVKLMPGDYRVRVTLGSKKTASRTTIWAEDRRLMLAPVVLKKGQVKTVEFVVNIRNASLATSEQDAVKAPRVGLRGDEDISRTWDDKLTIAFSGEARAVQSVEIDSVTTRRVFLAGDSTVTDQGGADYASWGQMLPRFLSPDVAVANHARSGETMKSFVTSLRWDKLLSEVRPGDIVLMQFGHNDQKKQWPRTYVSPDLGYPAWQKAFIADAQSRGAKVVLITPVSRRSFNKDGKIDNTLAGYDQAVRDTAEALNLPLIDLTRQTSTLYEALGPQKSPLAFANNGADKTHHNAYGAYVIANYVAQVLIDPAQGLDLKPATDFTAFSPTTPADPQNYEITPADWPLMREVVVKVSGN